ncbi:putative restriction endonuclease [Mucilaginibacter gracilis]|uniref:Putative restriction endonuclease n=1 Tax=Mucilaginibacter gracilis TaxID=423350 RepID=A0A495IZ66_9SPHI|nr:Uma2 family endonuclease [Mucilaginibacter gracilis]RKR81388.1 putative restriction endonuclease [Mucilaginibacter gracilis]
MLTDIPATAIDIYRMLPEGTRCEVIFNELSMSPSPSSEHQLLLMDLSAQLYNFLKQTQAGKVIPAPMDVYFDNMLSVVQPDILVLLNEHLDYIKPDGVYGAPDVVIEILSPNNRLHDTQKKKLLYEKGGVKEYFIVDPTNKEVALFVLNHTGQYNDGYQAKKLIKSAVLGCNIEF